MSCRVKNSALVFIGLAIGLVGEPAVNCRTSTVLGVHDR